MVLVGHFGAFEATLVERLLAEEGGGGAALARRQRQDAECFAQAHELGLATILWASLDRPG